jgi:beta-glucanase (GH16 family)
VFGAEKIVKFRPMAVAIAAPLVIGLTVQALGGSPAGAASDQVQKAALVAQETAAKRAPSASLSLLAAPVGQTASGKSGLTPGVATFRPARPGRAVTIQALHGSRWKTVVKGKEDRRGQLAFNVAATRGGTPVQFRAAAAKTKADPAVVGQPAQSANWAKSWGDEFLGSGALDPKRWHDRQVGPEYRLNRRLCSEVKKGAARRKGGSAVLEVRRLQNAKYAKKCKHGQYSNAMVIADSPESHLLYGFAAARVKFQANRGQHSAFWLQVPDNAAYVAGSPPATGAEIDVAEYFGDGRKKGGLASYVHWQGPKGDTSVGGEFNSRSMLPRGKEWSDAWHVYSVEWTPTRYVFRVDGIVTKVIRGGLSHRPEAVVLSALTSDWETPAMNARRFPTVTKYDWVRVWQQPNA